MAAVQADELPIADYDTLPVREIVAALRGLTDEADLTAVEQYERRRPRRTARRMRGSDERG